MEKLEIKGKVVFHRGEIKPPYCICCGNKDVPHAHIHGENIDYPEVPSLFAGLKDKSIQDYQHRFIHQNFNEIEGKTVKVTFEIER